MFVKYYFELLAGNTFTIVSIKLPQPSKTNNLNLILYFPGKHVISEKGTSTTIMWEYLSFSLRSAFIF